MLMRGCCEGCCGAGPTDADGEDETGVARTDAFGIASPTEVGLELGDTCARAGAGRPERPARQDVKVSPPSTAIRISCSSRVTSYRLLPASVRTTRTTPGWFCAYRTSRTPPRAMRSYA